MLDRWSLLWKLTTQNIESYLRVQQAKKAAESQQSLALKPGELSAGFRERLSLLAEQAQKEAPVVALATFPYKVRRTQSPREQLESCSMTLYHAPWLTPQTILQGSEEYNEIIRQVARDKRLLLIDVAERIPGDSQHFLDSVHYKDRGSARFAEEAARVLGEAEPVRQLVESRRKAAHAVLKSGSR